MLKKFGIENLCRINLRKGKKFKKGKFDIEYNKNKEDISEDRWYLVLFMKIVRRGVGVVVFYGKLFVIGGFDGTNFFNSVECYDFLIDEWKIVVSLNIFRYNVGIVVIKDYIYIVGGFGGILFLKSIECYDIKNDKWNCFVSFD